MTASETMVGRVVDWERSTRRQSRGFAAIVLGFALLAGVVISQTWPPPALADTTQDLQ